MDRKALSGTVKTRNTFVTEEEVASVCHEYSELYFDQRTMVLRVVPVRNVLGTTRMMEKQGSSDIFKGYIIFRRYV